MKKTTTTKLSVKIEKTENTSRKWTKNNLLTLLKQA
jgi:hypothetical protein